MLIPLHKITGWSQRYPEKSQPSELLVARYCVSWIGQHCLGILFSFHDFLWLWWVWLSGWHIFWLWSRQHGEGAPDISSAGLRLVLFASVPMETTIKYFLFSHMNYVDLARAQGLLHVCCNERGLAWVERGSDSQPKVKLDLPYGCLSSRPCSLSSLKDEFQGGDHGGIGVFLAVLNICYGPDPFHLIQADWWILGFVQATENHKASWGFMTSSILWMVHNENNSCMNRKRVIYGPVHLPCTLPQSNMLIGSIGWPTVLKRILEIPWNTALSNSLCHSTVWWAAVFCRPWLKSG